MNVLVCFVSSELSFNRSPRTLRLFLWRQIHDWVSNSVRKSNAPARCCPGALPPCGFVVFAQWTGTAALPWWWRQIRLWRVLEQSGAVLRVLPSRDGTGLWCEVSVRLYDISRHWHCRSNQPINFFFLHNNFIFTNGYRFYWNYITEQSTHYNLHTVMQS